MIFEIFLQRKYLCNYIYDVHQLLIWSNNNKIWTVVNGGSLGLVVFLIPHLIKLIFIFNLKMHTAASKIVAFLESIPPTDV